MNTHSCWFTQLASASHSWRSLCCTFHKRHSVQASASLRGHLLDVRASDHLHVTNFHFDFHGNHWCRHFSSWNNLFLCLPCLMLLTVSHFPAWSQRSFPHSASSAWNISKLSLILAPLSSHSFPNTTPHVHSPKLCLSPQNSQPYDQHWLHGVSLKPDPMFSIFIIRGLKDDFFIVLYMQSITCL